MQNEKQNRSLSEKIDSMQQIPPGFVFHTNTSWKEIENHLPETRRKGFTWYHIAAAVLLAVGIGYIFLVKKVQPSVLGEPVMVTMPKGTKAGADQQKDVISRPVTAKSIATKKTGKANTAITKQRIQAPTVSEPASVITSTQESSVPLLQKQQEITVEKTPAAFVIAKPVTPVTKKLRIVHLNELGGPSVDPGKAEMNTASIRKNNQAEEKEISLPIENTKQLLFFKKKPVITTTTIVENQ